MEAVRNITLIGMGALGILFGDRLNRVYGKHHVNFLSDPARTERYRTSEILCNGRACDFTFVSSEDSFPDPDLLIFAVKATQLEDAIREAQGHVGPDTILLSVLNGITSEEILGRAFGQEHVLYCVAQGMDAIKDGCSLRYSHPGTLCIGYPENEPRKAPMLEKTAAALKLAGIHYQIEKDILHRIWSKWMLNVGVNQVVMVSEGTYGTIQAPGRYRRMMIDAMREVRALAEKEGIHLTQEDEDGYVSLMDTLDPSSAPSMRQDGMAHRKSEAEFFSGTVIRKAAKDGVPVPVNEYLYQKIREMESCY